MSRLLPRSVKGLSVLAATIAAIVTVLLGAATVYISHEEIEAQIDHRIEREMDVLLDYHADNGFDRLARLVAARDGIVAGKTGYLAELDGDGRVMGYAVADPSGRRRAGSLVTSIPPTGWVEFLPIRRPDGSRGLAQALSRPLPGGGQLVVAGDRSALAVSDRRIITLFVIGLAMIVLTGIAATIGFGRLIHARLALISGTAQAIVEGDMARRVPLDGSGSEFERLAAILNAMLDRIDVLMAHLRHVSSDIAHDMRTPLHRIRGRFELLAAEEADPRRTAELEASIADIDRLLDLFAGLLGISEVEGFAVRRRFRPTRLDVVAGELADAYGPAFTDAGRALAVQAVPVTVNGDAQLLGRAIANLLENVLAHAGDADAWIRVGQQAGHACLEVSDDGPGVPSADAGRIFDRFTRLDASRSGEGHGLGLSMVRAIAQAHGGDVRAARDNRGFTVSMRVPTR